MNLNNKEQLKIVGTVERRLFDRTKFFAVLLSKGVYFELELESYSFTDLYEKALRAGFSKEYVNGLLEMSVKKMFADNFIWRFIKNIFNLDLRIPFITGIYTTNPIKSNLIVTKGHQQVAQQLGGTTASPMTAVAIGTGSTAPSAGDTALQAEIVSSGGQRGAATVSNVTTSTTGDTEQWVKTFNFTGSLAVTEEGILDNNTSGGNLLARQTFSVINVVNGDSLQITHQVTC